MLFVRPFNLANLSLAEGKESLKILYTEAGAAQIKEVQIYNLLEILSQYKNQQIPKEFFAKSCRNLQLDLQTASKFLIEEKRILVVLPTLEILTKKNNLKLVFSLPDHEVIELLKNFSEKELPLLTERNVSFTNLYDFKEKDVINPNDIVIVVVFQTQYDPEKIKQAYKKLAQISATTIFITSYILHDHFIIDAPYSYHFGTPCHYCHLDYILKFKRNGENQNSGGWVELVELLSNYHSLSLLSLHLTQLEKYFISYQLSLLIKRLVAASPYLFARIGSYVEGNLKTGEITKEMIPHSAECKCISATW